MIYSDDSIEIIKEVFDYMDCDNDGELNREEVENGIIALGNELTEKEKEQLFNNKFNFTFNDFFQICKSIKVNINELNNKMINAFKLLESNKKGFVSENIIKNFLQNNEVEEKDINKFINEANCDGDGYINYINLINKMLGYEPSIKKDIIQDDEIDDEESI
jgi:Ca2+-binding EF-hand superfamily protein